MFSRDFARGPTWPVHPTVDLALNFHKKIPLYVPSSLNISEGGHYCLSALWYIGIFIFVDITCKLANVKKMEDLKKKLWPSRNIGTLFCSLFKVF